MRQLDNHQLVGGQRVYVKELDVFGHFNLADSTVICEDPMPGFVYHVTESSLLYEDHSVYRSDRIETSGFIDVTGCSACGKDHRGVRVLHLDTVEPYFYCPDTMKHVFVTNENNETVSVAQATREFGDGLSNEDRGRTRRRYVTGSSPVMRSDKEALAGISGGDDARASDIEQTKDDDIVATSHTSLEQHRLDVQEDIDECIALLQDADHPDTFGGVATRLRVAIKEYGRLVSADAIASWERQTQAHERVVDSVTNPPGTGSNARQVGGSHYGLRWMQHWDVVALFGLDYFQGQITKYVMRWRDKNGVEDLKKAAHYLEKYIEVEDARGVNRVVENISQESAS